MRNWKTRFASLAACCAMMLLSFAAVAGASEKHPSVDEVSRLVMCPTCGTTVDRSDSPVANRIRAYIRGRIDDGWTRSRIVDGVVDQFGGDESLRAAPRHTGYASLAWWVPITFALLALAIGMVMARRWERTAERRMNRLAGRAHD